MIHEVNDRVFNELKQAATKIWNTYDDTYGYRTEKLDRLNSLTNVKDNYGTIIGMFDSTNQLMLMLNVGPSARKAITDWTGIKL